MGRSGALKSERGCVCLWESSDESGCPSGVLMAWGPQSRAWTLDSLHRPAACGVTQLFYPTPDGKQATLGCPLIVLALLSQSQDMAHPDPSWVRLQGAPLGSCLRHTLHCELPVLPGGLSDPAPSPASSVAFMCSFWGVCMGLRMVGSAAQNTPDLRLQGAHGSVGSARHLPNKGERDSHLQLQ